MYILAWLNSSEAEVDRSECKKKIALSQLVRQFSDEEDTSGSSEPEVKPMPYEIRCLMPSEANIVVVAAVAVWLIRTRISRRKTARANRVLAMKDQPMSCSKVPISNR